MKLILSGQALTKAVESQGMQKKKNDNHFIALRKKKTMLYQLPMFNLS